MLYSGVVTSGQLDGDSYLWCFTYGLFTRSTVVIKGISLTNGIGVICVSQYTLGRCNGRVETMGLFRFLYRGEGVITTMFNTTLAIKITNGICSYAF